MHFRAQFSPIIALFVCTFGLLALPASGASAPDELGDRMAAIQRAGEKVEAEALREVADMGTRGSLDALVAYYGSGASVYARLVTLNTLVAYAGKDELDVAACEFLTLQATGAKELPLRAAALEALNSFPTLGRGFLRSIVLLPAPDDVRVRALVLHARQASDEDKKWYRELTSPTESKRDKAVRRSSRNSGGEEPKFAHRLLPLRRVAFLASADSFTDKALLSLFKQEQDSEQRLAVVTELARRGQSKAAGLAEDLLESVDQPADVRHEAALLLFSLKGKNVLKSFTTLGSKFVTPSLLRSALAGIVAEHADSKLQSSLSKSIGKGKIEQRVFVLEALRGYQDGKSIVRARKELGNADERVVAAAARFLGAAGVPEDEELLRELFETSTSEAIVQDSLAGLTELLGGSEAWLDRLAGYARGSDPLRAPLAVSQLAKSARESDTELFLELLESPAWATRLAAMEVLVGFRKVEHLGPIIERMQSEGGRLRLAFAEALFGLTGQLFGSRAEAWKAWYDSEGKDQPFPSESKIAEARRLQAERKARDQTQVARFFGIPVESERVIFIIDVSGSMLESLRGRYVGRPGEVRIERAKAELIAAIRDLAPTAQFNIVAFSGGVNVWSDRSVGADEAPAKEEAVQWVSGLGAIGGTNLYGAVMRAFEDQEVDTIVLLSDGEPSVGELTDPGAIRAAVARRNSGRRVVIHTVSLGARLRTLEWLSIDSGGTHVLHVD